MRRAAAGAPLRQFFPLRIFGRHGRLAPENIFNSAHIFLASHPNKRILLFANSLQNIFTGERGSLMEDATKN
jgi:hypothetical protein